MRARRILVPVAASVVFVTVLPGRAFAVNTRPATPTITEPASEGQIAHPADVHMETSPFSDADVGNTHNCTDWEIRLTSTSGEVVWASPCSPELVHIHLADGSFVGSYTGRTELDHDTTYVLRARHKDSSGDPSTEWSDWGTRSFRTSSPPPPGTSTLWTVQQPGFEVDVFATGFQLPVNIAFIPNPTETKPSSPYFYVTELYGTIKVVSRDGTVSDYIRGVLNYRPSGRFPGSGEQGLTGIVVDPVSGDVFASMLYEASPGGPTYPKVVRFHSNHNGAVAGSSETILDMPGESQGQSHQISNLSIGPDGKLYVHMGDGFDAATAQNLSSFRGKILRLGLDGSVPGDNPFYNASDGITARDYVFAYGFRNPFGGDWRAADGRHYEVENGPSVDRFAKVARGQNYFWDGTDASMRNLALYNWSPAVAPVNLAFVQPETFGGSGFPPSEMGHAFVTESGPTYATGPQTNGKRITEFVLDASGNVQSGPTQLINYTGTGKSTAAGLAAGPDGLYFTDLYKDSGTAATDVGANVLRVRWTGSEPPPPSLLRNGGFEADANADGRPDSWSLNQRFTRSDLLVFSGGFAGRHHSIKNWGYAITQRVPDLVAGNSYDFSGRVNIPATTDAFTFSLQVRWLNSSGSTISTTTFMTYTAATGGWSLASAALISPAGTDRAKVRMVAKSLKATVYVDDFVFG